MDIQALVAAFLGVTIAEMGDKTQLLTVAFSSKFKPLKVLAGVAAASAASHGMSVLLGSLLALYTPIYCWVQLAAALSFLFFGLWTLKGEKEEEGAACAARYGAVITVFAAFFVAELGDKTQLFTVSLAAKHPHSPVWVLAGAVLGMLTANCAALLAGMTLQKHLSQRRIQYLSAAVFIAFGLIALYQTLTGQFGFPADIALGMSILAGVATGFASQWLLQRKRL